MSEDHDRSALEETAELLVGHSLSRVRYLGFWEKAPEEPGALVEWVELTMDDGAILRVTSEDDEGLGIHHLAIHEGPCPELPGPFHILDCSQREDWRSRLDTVISSATVHWPEVERARVTPSAVGFEKIALPLLLELRFEGGAPLMLAAGTQGSDGEVVAGTENVIALFGQEAIQSLCSS